MPSSSTPGLSAKTAPCISVIIPCYNRAQTVRAAVDSVLAQTWPNFSVIAVDDNSTDATLEVLKSIDDPRLRVVQNPGPRGPSAGRNYGVSLADSPWIAFQDSDDLWRPERLARQMAEVGKTGAAFAYCGMVVKNDITPESPVLRRYPGPEITHKSGDILPSLVRDSFISTQMILMQRDLFHQAGGFDPDLPALVDWDLCLRTAQLAPVAFVDEDLVIQRFTDNSITRAPRKRTRALAQILNKHHALFARYPGVLAHHYQTLAGALRRQGNYPAAAEQGFAAWRAEPTPKRLALALYTKTRAFLTRPRT